MYQPKRTILDSKPVSNHEGDKHLSIVLSKFGNEWCTSLYNAEFDGHYHGHYFFNEAAARRDFKERK